MIYVTGDTHGHIDVGKLNSKNLKLNNINMKKGDYLIILGDFGFVWDGSKSDLYWQKWLKSKPWTTLFIDGNHENHDLLEQYPVVDKFNGKVHKINSKVYHLMRGEIYNIEDKSIFCFGGAKSVDKAYRTEGKSWWSKELPSKQEMEYGIQNLEKSDYKVDYVLTHTCPSDVFYHVVQNGKSNGELERYLNFIKHELDEKNISYKWKFGHYHKDLNIDNKFQCMYHNIEKLY